MRYRDVGRVLPARRSDGSNLLVTVSAAANLGRILVICKAALQH
jgi:hypothetical protein